MEQQQKEEKAKEPIGVFGRLFTDNATARILDYFITHRYHSYSITDVARTLELSCETVSAAINQLEKRELVRQDKAPESSINSKKELRYTLFIESMTANAIIRTATEIANTEKNLLESEKQNR